MTKEVGLQEIPQMIVDRYLWKWTMKLHFWLASSQLLLNRKWSPERNQWNKTEVVYGDTVEPIARFHVYLHSNDLWTRIKLAKRYNISHANYMCVSKPVCVCVRACMGVCVCVCMCVRLTFGRGWAAFNSSQGQGLTNSADHGNHWGCKQESWNHQQITAARERAS